MQALVQEPERVREEPVPEREPVPGQAREQAAAQQADIRLKPAELQGPLGASNKRESTN